MSSQLWTLYLDAAGDPGWVAPRGDSDSPSYVVAGVALTPEANLQAKERVSKILGGYSQNPHLQELKYTEVIFGRGLFDGVDRPERLGVKDEVLELLINIDARLFGTILEKGRHQRQYGAQAFEPKRWAIQNTVDRFDQTVESEGAIGQVVVDAEELEYDKSVQELFNNLRSEGTKVKPTPASQRFLDFLINTVTFVPSEMSAGIQLADFVARIIWEAKIRDKPADFNAVRGQFYGPDHDPYEPSTLPG